jgi:predicted nucleic acid-binding protein
MTIPRKLWCRPFLLDANRVNARCKLRAMNQLEKWHTDGVISLKFPEHAQSEAESSLDARRTRKARDYIIPHAYITTDDERKLSEIERIVFGDARLSKNDRNDALIVFTAKKYSGILVTGDQKILRAAKQLHQRVGVEVMSDEDAVKLCRKLLPQRDQMARADAMRKGSEVPRWVGKD